jgi:hypothetical protein
MKTNNYIYYHYTDPSFGQGIFRIRSDGKFEMWSVYFQEWAHCYYCKFEDLKNNIIELSEEEAFLEMI